MEIKKSKEESSSTDKTENHGEASHIEGFI